MLYNSSLSSVHPLCWTIWFPLSWSSALPASSLWVSTVSQVPSALMSSLAACVCELCLPLALVSHPAPASRSALSSGALVTNWLKHRTFTSCPRCFTPLLSPSAPPRLQRFGVLHSFLSAGATPVSKLEKPPVLQCSSGWCRAPGAQSAARKGHCKVSSQENSANPLKSSEFTT